MVLAANDMGKHLIMVNEKKVLEKIKTGKNIYVYSRLISGLCSGKARRGNPGQEQNLSEKRIDIFGIFYHHPFNRKCHVARIH